NQPRLGPEWCFMRSANSERWSLNHKESCLTLYGTADTLNDAGCPAFLGRRQQHFACQVKAQLTFTPQVNGEEEGLTVYMNEKFHYDIAVVHVEGFRKLIFSRTLGLLWKVEHVMPWANDSVCLTIQANTDSYAYGFA